MLRRRQSISADRARGGGIVLRRHWERGVFIAGLIGAVALGVVLVVWTYWR